MSKRRDRAKHEKAESARLGIPFCEVHRERYSRVRTTNGKRFICWKCTPRNGLANHQLPLLQVAVKRGGTGGTR